MEPGHGSSAMSVQVLKLVDFNRGGRLVKVQVTFGGSTLLIELGSRSGSTFCSFVGLVPILEIRPFGSKLRISPPKIGFLSPQTEREPVLVSQPLNQTTVAHGVCPNGCMAQMVSFNPPENSCLNKDIPQVKTLKQENLEV